LEQKVKYSSHELRIKDNSIILDSEINLDKYGFKGGDYFKLININGQAMLIKVDALVKFIKEGELEKVQNRD
jgi:hypothetical protein